MGCVRAKAKDTGQSRGNYFAIMMDWWAHTDISANGSHTRIGKQCLKLASSGLDYRLQLVQLPSLLSFSLMSFVTTTLGLLIPSFLALTQIAAPLSPPFNNIEIDTKSSKAQRSTTLFVRSSTSSRCRNSTKWITHSICNKFKERTREHHLIILTPTGLHNSNMTKIIHSMNS